MVVDFLEAARFELQQVLHSAYRFFIPESYKDQDNLFATVLNSVCHWQGSDSVRRYPLLRTAFASQRAPWCHGQEATTRSARTMQGIFKIMRGCVNWRLAFRSPSAKNRGKGSPLLE